MTIYFQGGEQESFFNPTGTASTSAGMFDSAWARQANNGGCRAYSKVAITTFYATWSSRNATTILGNTHVWAIFYDLAGNQRVRFYGTANNIFRVEYWKSGAWVACTNLVGITGVWGVLNRFVLHVDIAGGKIELHRDGVLVGTDTGLDLSGITDLSSVYLADPVGDWYHSQVIIADENLLLWNSKTAYATANGTDSTDGTGTYTDINESTLSDTTYISFTANGQKRSFTTVDRAASLSRYPKGITVTGRLMRLDATGPQQARPYLLIGGTRYYGTTFTLTTGWDSYQYTWMLNPSTGLAWALSEAESASLEFGWEAVT